ncbi:hypothetical protein QAD02_013239 [Eretmocerus hayati]|uniref:Uncharacterized protein n=1 Tax=Eretmocerus hayati TaxID=131215 RepID=A0ACC2P242_9HYME|nr:hypothetical protein QAD02_013239 [Eretmocerus hayati]
MLSLRDVTAFFLFPQRCHEDSVPMFFYLLPAMYQNFGERIFGSAQIFYLVVSAIDPLQLQDLIWKIVQGNLKMFDQSSLKQVLDSSLGWGSFEQHCFWQILLAHSISVEYVLPLVSHLHPPDHAQPLTSLLLMLIREK